MKDENQYPFAERITMRKQKARQAVRKNIQEIFYSWCEEHKRNPNAECVIAFDKLNPGYKLLDHEKAKKDGYYFHLRSQAAAIISSWATVEVLRPSGGQVPFADSPAREVKISVQDSYHLPGKGAIRVARMDEADLTQLINMFKIEAEHKMQRAYIIAKR